MKSNKRLHENWREKKNELGNSGIMENQILDLENR